MALSSKVMSSFGLAIPHVAVDADVYAGYHIPKGAFDIVPCTRARTLMGIRYPHHLEPLVGPTFPHPSVYPALTCNSLTGPWRIMNPNTPDRLNLFPNASSTTARSNQTTRKTSRLDSVGVCAWADTLQTRPSGPRSRPSWRCLRCRHRGTRTGARCRWCPSLRAGLRCRSTFSVCEKRGLIGVRSGDVDVHFRSRVVSCREWRGWTWRCSNG